MPNRSVISLEGEGQQQRRPLIEILRNEGIGRVTPRTIDRDTLFYSEATGRPMEEVRQIVESRMTGVLNQQALGVSHQVVADTIEGAVESEEDLNERIASYMDEMRENDMLSRFIPASMTAALRSNISGSREMAMDRIARVLMTGERISERIEDMGGFGAGLLDFAEILVDPLDIIHQRTYRRLVEEYQSLLAPGVSIEEFEAGLERILTEAEDAGFFSDQNRFFFGSFLDTLGHGVYSGQQQANEILGWLDIGITGAAEAIPLTMRGTRLVRNTSELAALTGTTALNSINLGIRGVAGATLDAARDSLSALTSLTPSLRTQQIAQNALNRAILDETTGAVNPAMHTSPSVATPTMVRGAFWSAPNHTAVRNFEVTAESVQMIRDWAVASGRVFDDETIQAFGARLSADRMAYLRSSGFNRILDVEVGADEFNNLVAVDIIGTSRGGYYASRTTAERAAQYGEEPIMVGEGQWALLRRNNISADNFDFLEELGYTADIEGFMLYRATDPEQLGDGFWARYGSPGAQADMNVSSHLFSAGSVAQRAMHEINTQTKRITRSLRNRQVSEVYGVFEHMAQLPQREAFTRQEFVNWFTSTYNRQPLDGQVALYLLEQQRLDAQLFVNANEMYRRAVDMNARVFRDYNGEEYVVREVTVDSLADNALVNVDGRVVPARELPEGTRIFENQSTNSIPGNVRYIASEAPEVRAVYHSDFLVRNSGGHRGYVLNEMQFLVKQPQTRRFADGSEQVMSPRTLLGSRTPEEARAAVRDMDNIMGELHRAVPIGRMDADEYLDAVRAANTPALNRVVVENNGWNPGVTSIDELVDFASDRGLDLRTQFRVVREGDTMDEFLEGLGDSLFVNRSMTHSDDVHMLVSRGGRGSMPLPRYGGGTVGMRPVRDVMEGSYASTVNTVAETAYRIRAAQGNIKAAIDSGVMREAYKEIAHLPLRTQIRRILDDNLIDVSGARGADKSVGPRLKLDLERLQFRLQRDSWVTRNWRNTTRTISNYLYGRGFEWGAGKFDRWSADPVSALRGLTFDMKLGMFNPIQLLMQSVQVVNIVGIAGTRGLRGAAMYPAVRFALNNGHPDVIRRLGDQISSITGMSSDDFVNLVEMLRRSGRQIVDNNLAEMTPSEDAMSRIGGGAIGQGIRDMREAGRVFFKEGDLVARITGFNAAYLRYLDEVGPISGPTDARALRFIQAEEQRLTQYMTSESRQAYEQLPFMQFMSYQLRINEAIFAGTFSGRSKRVLTNTERARLAAVHFGMFGMMATTPTAFLVDYLNANTSVGMEQDERVLRLWQRGFVDSVLSWVTGTDTAASRRFSSSGGMYRILEQMAQDDPLSIFAGPSGQVGGELVTTSFSTLVNGLRAIATGETQSLQDDVLDLVRLVSSGNQTFNAIYAWKYGQMITRNFGQVTGDLTRPEAVYLAFGIPLEEVDAIYAYMGQRRIQRAFLENAAQQATELYDRAFEAMRRDDHETARRYFNMIAAHYRALDPWEREQVERQVYIDDENLTDAFLLELMQRHVTTLELID